MCHCRAGGRVHPEALPTSVLQAFWLPWVSTPLSCPHSALFLSLSLSLTAFVAAIPFSPRRSQPGLSWVFPAPPVSCSPSLPGRYTNTCTSPPLASGTARLLPLTSQTRRLLYWEACSSSSTSLPFPGCAVWGVVSAVKQWVEGWQESQCWRGKYVKDHLSKGTLQVPHP